MSEIISKLCDKENLLIRRVGGVWELPESYNDLNDLQRDKIKAVKDEYGTAYVGCINYYDDERKNLTHANIYKEYTGETIYNFEANFVVPCADVALAEMIYEWNLPVEMHKNKNLIGKIYSRIESIGGMFLIFT